MPSLSPTFDKNACSFSVFGFSNTSFGSPSSITTPSAINTILSETLFAKPISCVTIIIVRSSSFNERITFNTSPVSSGSSALVGSSKQRIFGFNASARAIATRWHCPPDNSQGYAFRFSVRPIFSNNSSPSKAIFCFSSSLLFFGFIGRHDIGDNFPHFRRFVFRRFPQGV